MKTGVPVCTHQCIHVHEPPVCACVYVCVCVSVRRERGREQARCISNKSVCVEAQYSPILMLIKDPITVYILNQSWSPKYIHSDAKLGN